MERITSELITEFIAQSKIPFLSTQSRLCIPIIDRLCKKMSHGIKFDDIKICDDLIIDGHHRYLSSLVAGVEIGKVSSHKTSATKPVEWNMVLFDTNDWDTPSKISHLNELDALYNNLDLEFVTQITLDKK